jgi:hypothetical protein
MLEISRLIGNYLVEIEVEAVVDGLPGPERDAADQ